MKEIKRKANMNQFYLEGAWFLSASDLSFKKPCSRKANKYVTNKLVSNFRSHYICSLLQRELSWKKLLFLE